MPIVEIPPDVKLFLEKSFVVHLKRGLVATFYVDSAEPTSVTNVKRSFLSQIQLDLTGKRRIDAENSLPAHVQQPEIGDTRSRCHKQIIEL